MELPYDLFVTRWGKYSMFLALGLLDIPLVATQFRGWWYWSVLAFVNLGDLILLDLNGRRLRRKGIRSLKECRAVAQDAYYGLLSSAQMAAYHAAIEHSAAQRLGEHAQLRLIGRLVTQAQEREESFQPTGPVRLV